MKGKNIPVKKETIERIMRKILYKKSMTNYLATLLGVVIYVAICGPLIIFYQNNMKNFGVLGPLVLVVIIMLMTTLAPRIIPSPVTTYSEDKIED